MQLGLKNVEQDVERSTVVWEAGAVNEDKVKTFFLYNYSNTFLYFCKFCKQWTNATILVVVVPNALYLLVVDEILFNATLHMYTIS